MQKDTKQLKAESHIIGESLFNYRIINSLKKEDFIYYRKEFEAIHDCQGDQMRIISEYPELYDIQDSIVFLAINNRRLIVWLTESTYKRTLQRTLEDLRGNTPDLS